MGEGIYLSNSILNIVQSALPREMGYDEISTQVVRLMDWDMLPSVCAGSSSEKAAYQIPHLSNESVSSISYTFCIRESKSAWRDHIFNSHAMGEK